MMRMARHAASLAHSAGSEGRLHRATIVSMPSDDSPEEPRGFLARLRERLNRSGTSLARDVRALLRGRKIDAAVLEDLETRLLMADIGVEATSDILSDLNRRVALRELDDVEALINAVRERLVQIL